MMQFSEEGILSVKILLAEDDEIMRVTLRDRLVKNGWRVDEVADGKEALVKLSRNIYKVVVSDIRMPRASGFELLDEIRTHYPATRIIFMTAYGNEKEGADCLRKGATDYLLKPFEMDDLVHRIQRLLDENGCLRQPA